MRVCGTALAQTAEFARDRNEWSKLTSAIEEAHAIGADRGVFVARMSCPGSIFTSPIIRCPIVVHKYS